MGAFKDLRGQRFGRLTVIERAENKGGHVYWRCRCDCGNETVVTGSSLKSGLTRSCGCLSREVTSKRCLKDLAGKQFGRLTVLGRAANKGKHTYWLCRCNCGNEVIVEGSGLKCGVVLSCGCLKKERATTHGMTGSQIFNTWQGIKQRCFDPNSKSYKRYGGRGISIYPAWIDDFQAFFNYVSTLEHFGEVGMTLDRINNDGNYEPGNLQWSTKSEQARNRRDNVFVEYNGERMTLAEAAEKIGINYYTLWARYRAGDYERGRLFRPIGSK